MKVLSIIIPCYNSAAYMQRCIDSVLLGGDFVEVIIVNDGSIDKTFEIAEGYQHAFPEIVKVIHQKNGGHGQAINSGLREATGKYVKVVDSDDWLETRAYQKVLSFLAAQTTDIDMIISNYVYEKEGVRNKKVIHYTKFLPTDQTFSWENVRFPIGKYLLMHSVIYRTQLLKEMKLELPQHTFYVDNLYVFQPLTQVKSLHYLDEDLYRYYIGREDQSVNEAVMIRRVDQQIEVNKRMIGCYAQSEGCDQHVTNYMRRYVEIITTISSVLLIKEGSQESLQKKTELWDFLKKTDNQLYKKIRRSFFGQTVNLPGKLGRKTALGAYHWAQRLYGFN